MKAIVCTGYGPPEALQLEEVEKPAPKHDEVLIEVHATSIVYSDLAFARGKPLLVRLMGSGALRPKHRILGTDVAGRVEAVGRNVKQFQPGDEVFGDLSGCGRGSYAEYVCAREDAVALKPTNCSFEEAAAAPESAVVALQGLRDRGEIQPGHKVLVNGASGGIGTFAVQIAKSFEAEVTGVCGTRNVDMVRSIGADHVIDYTQEDFTENGERYDLILATVGYRSIFDYKRALGPKGIHVVTGGSMSQIFQTMLVGPWMSMGGGKRMVNLSVRPNQKDLVYIKELVETDKVRPVIDQVFAFSEIAKALRYYEKGHARGKVVITLEKGVGL